MNNKGFLEPQKTSFPDPMAPSEEQKTEEYGLKWARAIEGEWFHKKDSGTSAFYGKREGFDFLRTYARGDQDEQIYKNLLGKGDDKHTYSNFDWRPIQVVPKFVKLIVNQMTERLFEVQANATDPYSTSMRAKYRERLQGLMLGKDMLMRAKELQGVDLLPRDMSEVPDSQEEVDLRMKLKYKQNAEIASETAIRFTLDLNDYDEVQSKVVEDIATIGVGGTKHYTDIHKGVMVEYVDPANMVHSFSSSRDFKDVYYYGEVERMTLGELRRIMRAAGKELEDDDYKELASNVNNWANFHGESSTRTVRDEDIDGMMVDVMHFTFKSNDRAVYKKKYSRNGKGYKMIKKDSTFEKKDANLGYDVVKKDREVWWEGSIVLGTEHIFGYKKSENMVREKGQLNRTLPKYSMYAPEIYKGKIKSTVGRVVQYVDLMQQVHIKIQQMVAKARPAGVYIDVDGLTEIPMGDGQFLTIPEALKLYDETGNVIGTSQGADGGYNYGREPIRELKNGVIDGIDRLINTYNFYLNQLRDAIGIPAGMDASNPHPDTLVGVQKQVALNSNTATRHILDGALHITKRTAIGVNLRLKDIFKYSNLKDAYINAIGKTNVDILESLKNYHLHDFAILISLKPDAEQKQQLEQNIQIALDRDQISLDDAIEIREVGNLTLANELLKVRRKRREKEMQESKEREIKINAEENAKAAERASAAKQQEIQVKLQADSSLEQLKGQNALAKIDAEKRAKQELMEQEFQYNMVLKGADAELQDDLKDRDFKRQQTFESSEDNISGNIEMGELEPS